MPTQPEQLRDRAKQFAIRMVTLFRAIRTTEEGRICGRQLLRSATSVAANYRAVGRARSRAEFISKIGVVVEEMDETVFWLEFVADSNIISKSRLRELLKEANELLAIFAASQRTARNRATKMDAKRSNSMAR
jgi:four helix bundle protein